ncbi:synembryn-A [Asbolus verrucosus]|uniref:Synembryn-A n=1 Tax=Asbolus verrucosus TaxID=1661398 RepID=A0A482VAV3_ASBVE|nr:synembryn-A [Asbolus verrucosus]
MDNHINNIINGDAKKAAKSLQDFVEATAQTFIFPELSKSDKRKQLWEALFTLAGSTNDKNVLTNCFTAVRILRYTTLIICDKLINSSNFSREKVDLNELITNEWFDLIKTHSGLSDPKYVFDDEHLSVAIEVQKSLCNLVFNSSVAAGMCCKNGILQLLTERVKTHAENSVPKEIKFFDVKLIFLLTALCCEVRSKVKDDMEGVTSLINLLDFILKEAAEQSLPNVISLDDQNVDLVCEILKALFNLTLNSYGISDDKDEEQCAHLVNVLRIYLLIPTTSKEKTVVLQNNIINLLTNMPSQTYKDLITTIQPEQNISNKFQYDGLNMTAFYEILKFLQDKFSDETSVNKQYEVLSPVVTVLLKCANSERAIRKYLRSQILPPLKDVHNRPEQGSTLRNHLCRLLTTPITQLRDLVAELLFVLCKKNVKRMIKYTGYGNAAGLFAQRGLLGGRPDKEAADYSSDSEDSETEEYAEYKHGINPVIGCYEEPHPNAMEDMTEEQKEYEAMKLVELMDNLTKCGAIKPCRVGADGKPHPIEHVLQLQEGLKCHRIEEGSDSD